MAPTYWHKQSEPLFPELEWNKPERRDQAGRLLIIGGNLHNLSAPARAYEYAKQAGIGALKVVLPDKTKQLVSTVLPDALFLPSTTTGEFSNEEPRLLLEYALWADTVLLPGNLGRNSQTTILIEELIRTYSGQMVLSCDAIEAAGAGTQLLANRKQTTLILSFAQLQAFLKLLKTPRAITYQMGLIKCVEVLHAVSLEIEATLVTLHQNQIIVAYRGAVSTTKVSEATAKSWRVTIATTAACFQTWNPSKPFESLTHSSAQLKS